MTKYFLIALTFVTTFIGLLAFTFAIYAIIIRCESAGISIEMLATGLMLGVLSACLTALMFRGEL